MKLDSKKIYWIDNLRAIAVIGVVIIHVTMNSVAYDVTNSLWSVGNFYNGFSRFSVPVFVLITGSLLLSPFKNISIKPFLKKRVLKILIPFVFWNILYSIYNLKLYFGSGIPFNIENVLSQVKSHWVNGADLHLWYIYVLIGLYLFIPIINKWVQHASQNEFLYFIGLWVVSLFFWGDKSSIYSVVYSFSGFVGFLVLGYFLFTKKFDNIKYISLLCFILFLIGAAITVVGTSIISADGVFNHKFYGFLAPNVALMAASFYVFVKYTPLFNNEIKLLRIISQYSFGIYFIHIFSLRLLEKFGITYNLINPYFGIPITILSCLLVSIICLWVMSKIPLLKKVTGNS